MSLGTLPGMQAVNEMDEEAEAQMKHDLEKVDEVVLALMQLTLHRDGDGTRAWKGFDWDTLNRLHEKRYITNPKTKAKSVVLTEEGVRRSAELFEAYFEVSE